MYKRSSQGWLKHLDFFLWDEVALQLAFILSYSLRHGSVLPYSSSTYRVLAILYIVIDFLVVAIFDTLHNVVKRGKLRELFETLKHVILVFIFMMIFMFAFQSGSTYSRVTIYLTTVFHLLFGYLLRLLWKLHLKSIGVGTKDSAMILVAEEDDIPMILDRSNSYSGLILIDRDGAGERIQEIPIVANMSNAADFLCREWVDEVFLYPKHFVDLEGSRPLEYESLDEVIKKGLPEDALQKEVKSTPVADLLEACRQMSIPVHVRLPLMNIEGKSFIERVNGFTVLTTTSNYVSPHQMLLKRALDILGGLIGSLFALIIMAVVGPKIKKASPGPILFKQTRVGQNGKKFKIYKIRSMYMDAEERKKELLKENRVADGMMFKMDWDPRVIGNEILEDGTQKTGIGDYIRRTSLDEFPQFFNVLKGEMSLVGTRPPTEDEWAKYEYHHRARLVCKPGITGMWQVSGRSEITDFEDVVKLDTEYIANWSIALDLKILFKTLGVLASRKGAM